MNVTSWAAENGFAKTQQAPKDCADATMGLECSAIQFDQIISLTTRRSRVWVVSNGDIDGDSFGQSVVSRVSPYRFVRWVRLEDNQQPTDLSETDLAERFAW